MFPFVGDGNSDNNLESIYIYKKTLQLEQGRGRGKLRPLRCIPTKGKF
jgi:hypothetical protein